MSGTHLKGKTYEEIYGEQKAKELKKIRSDHFKKIRKGKDPWNKGKTNIFSEETLKTMRRKMTLTGKKFLEKHPILKENERYKVVENILYIPCKQCKDFFIPTRSQLYERVRSLKSGRNGSFLFCSETCKIKSPLYYKKNIFKDDHEELQFKKYSKMVYRLTNLEIKNHKIKNIDMRGLNNGYEIDHIYSIYDGFKNNIAHEHIASYINLKVIPRKENRSKKSSSIISSQTLLHITI